MHVHLLLFVSSLRYLTRQKINCSHQIEHEAQVISYFPLSIFRGGPALACTGMSLSQILLKLRMMELTVTTTVIRHAKLQSNFHHKQTNTELFTGRMSFLSANQRHQST